MKKIDKKIKNEKMKNDSEDIILDILDIKDLSDGAKSSVTDELFEYTPPAEIKKTGRKEDWSRHIEKFGLESYQKRLEKEVRFAKAYRKNYLKKKYPFASFKTLDGKNSQSSLSVDFRTYIAGKREG